MDKPIKVERGQRYQAKWGSYQVERVDGGRVEFACGGWEPLDTVCDPDKYTFVGWAPCYGPKPPVEKPGRFQSRATELGALVDSKNAAYGDSAMKSGKILAALYPDGVRPDQYDDVLLIVRILDKLSRIAQRGADGKDKGGESPYGDICGYGLIGLVKDEGGKR